MPLKGKCAPITGGKSRIGHATAQRFVPEGARVAITGRDAATLAAAVNELGVTAIRLDVLDAPARSSLFDRIRDEIGPTSPTRPGTSRVNRDRPGVPFRGTSIPRALVASPPSGLVNIRLGPLAHPTALYPNRSLRCQPM
jgi:NAD(P)-dependent dehydrogenase (short-subunit alcohol dehydrogenase family)